MINIKLLYFNRISGISCEFNPIIQINKKANIDSLIVADLLGENSTKNNIYIKNNILIEATLLIIILLAVSIDSNI